MEKKALEVLRLLEEHHFSAYIVGGYVRDYLLGMESVDIDICTSARPKEIIDVFGNENCLEILYGSVKVLYKGSTFDITTFRKENKYENNRKPVKIKYIKNLKKDLLRRDFTINTFCMNSSKEVLDILNVKEDLNNKIIKTVGNPRYRLKEDALRILRAVRFATRLDFELDKKTKIYIMKYGYLLKNLSYFRKKEELDKIFSSVNNKRGISLLLELGLAPYLELDNLKDVRICNDLLGIWCQLENTKNYNFSFYEKEQMTKIKELLEKDLFDSKTLYHYGLYLVTIAADIRNINKKEINLLYHELPIFKRSDIDMTPLEIASLLQRKPGSYIKTIMEDMENAILEKRLINTKENLKQYIIKQYL